MREIAQSAFGRDQRLANHVDGLLKLYAGELPVATITFQRPIFSPAMGYNRSNYDLALALMQLSRAREAIAVIQSALHGVSWSWVGITRNNSTRGS